MVADALHAAIAGRSITAVSAPGPLAVRGTPAELDALVGQRVASIQRRGEFLLVDLERDAIAINPMLTGRLQLAAPGAGLPAKTAVVLAFGARAPAPEGRRGVDPRGGLAVAGCRSGRGPLQGPDPDGQGLPAAGRHRPANPGLGEAEQGPDADDPALTLDLWRERIRRHPGELKNLLRNQSFVAGIGNAYSDEILHAAGLLPFRKRSSLAAEEVDSLYQATRETLASAITILRERVPPTFEKQVRDFLAVHDKGGQACPRCGTRITEVKAGGFITSYCRGCQH